MKITVPVSLELFGGDEREARKHPEYALDHCNFNGDLVAIIYKGVNHGTNTIRWTIIYTPRSAEPVHK